MTLLGCACMEVTLRERERVTMFKLQTSCLVYSLLVSSDLSSDSRVVAECGTGRPKAYAFSFTSESCNANVLH